ncbi:MAG: hypothetical protein FJW92_04370, partial [Actinobacteria bacterium]|nr:hypothetical protein [Actinomycetota bacterium]
GKSCTATTTAGCTVEGLTNGTAYAFRVTATNALGTSPGSAESATVTPRGSSSSGGATGPTTLRKLADKSVLNRKPRVGTTTGKVPSDITRISQSAKPAKTRASKAKTARGRCRITTVRNKKTKKVIKRTYKCTITLRKGRWTITTNGREATRLVAQGVRTVKVRRWHPGPARTHVPWASIPAVPSLRVLAVAGAAALASTALLASPAFAGFKEPPRCTVASGTSCAGQDLRGLDLRGKNLRGKNLRGADLRRATLHRADLRGADLTGAKLRGARMRHADLRGAILRRADFTKADLRGSRFRGPAAGAGQRANGAASGCPYSSPMNLQYYMEGANFTGGNLANADYAMADAQGANFTNANLSGSNFIGANLDDTTWKGANVAGTDFGCGFMAGANLSGIQGSPDTYPQQLPTGWIITSGQFVGPGVTISGNPDTGGGWSGADFRGADLTGATISPYTDISWANFSGVNLTDATFTYASGQNASFAGANLTGANFQGGSFPSASFVNANFTNAALRAGVDMSNTNMSGANFTGAWAHFGVMMNPSAEPIGFPSAWGVGSTGSNVTCAPGVVTDEWATCFPRVALYPPGFTPPTMDFGDLGRSSPRP